MDADIAVAVSAWRKLGWRKAAIRAGMHWRKRDRCACWALLASRQGDYERMSECEREAEIHAENGALCHAVAVILHGDGTG